MPRDNIRQLRRPELGDAAPGRRWKTEWPAELGLSEGRVACVVQDISSWGARLSLAEPPAEESRVWLVIESIGLIAARVVWRRDDQVGLQFLEQQSWIRRLYVQRLDPATWQQAGRS